MAITIKEKPDSPTFTINANGGSLLRKFFLRGTDNEADVYSTVLSEVESIYQGFIRTGISTPQKYAGGFYDVEVQYGDPSGNGASSGGGSGGTPVGETPVNPTSIPAGVDPLDPVNDGMEFTFDAGAETQHITQSISTRSQTRRGGGSAPGFFGAIGVTANGEVKGCDIYKAKSEFTVTVQRAEVTLNYFRTLVAAVAKTNNAAWGGFQTDECLYLGCNGQGTQRGQWTMSHRFACGKTETSVFICTGLTVSEVRPFDHLWVYYTPDSDTSTGGLSIPEAAYVEQVYYQTNFSALEIGV